MMLAGMIEARSHQPSGPRVLCHNGASRLQVTVDFIEDLGYLRSTGEYRRAAVRPVPIVEGNVNELGNLRSILRGHRSQTHRVHVYLSLFNARRPWNTRCRSPVSGPHRWRLSPGPSRQKNRRFTPPVISPRTPILKGQAQSNRRELPIVRGADDPTSFRWRGRVIRHTSASSGRSLMAERWYCKHFRNRGGARIGVAASAAEPR